MSLGGHLTWAEIDIGALRHNYWLIKNKASGAGIMAVVKADAYGHGMVEASKTFIEEGVSYLAVAFVKEGIELREAEIKTPTLVFARPTRDFIGTQIQNSLDVTIADPEDVELVAGAAKRLSIPARVHLNVDTGMSRLGVEYGDVVAVAQNINSKEDLVFAGIYSHLATSDEFDPSHSKIQIQKYKDVIEQIRNEGISPGLCHLANSGGLLNLPDSIFNMVRIGIALYGHNPNPLRQKEDDLLQVMTLKSTVSQIRTVTEGTAVSYGRTWIAGEQTKLATIPIGYADGIDRSLPGKLEVLINGKRFNVVGRVTMDMMMADIGNSDVKVGDEVVVYGTQGTESISISEVAQKFNSISYEITCSVSKRVPRVYVNS
ncbi:MAG: alanine racemase [Candidatus Marinimicrobia bacterium]|nr:alanine racemase [Candidatus Neomarinimicrobiota bacterium]